MRDQHIEQDVELNDGCSSQFKCIRAFSALEVNEFEDADFTETEASKLINKGDTALIKTEDYYPSYLLKLLKDPLEV